VWLSVQLDLPLANALVQGGVVFVPGDAAKAVAVMVLVTGGYLAHGRGVVG